VRAALPEVDLDGVRLEGVTIELDDPAADATGATDAPEPLR
jgi:hypothetical protein